MAMDLQADGLADLARFLAPFFAPPSSRVRTEPVVDVEVLAGAYIGTYIWFSGRSSPLDVVV